MKKVLYLFLVVLATSCSSLTVSFDYDKSANFAKYKSYAFTQESLNLGIQQLNRDRLLRAIDTEMAAKGFTKSDTPDVLVDLHVKAEEKVQATATNTGMGGMYGGYGRYGYGGGFSTTQVDYNKYVVGTLFMDFVDRSSEKIVWQGRATKTLDENVSAEKREANINYAVKEMMTKYPPK